MNKEQPSYYTVIPANVRYDKNLSLLERLLYAEIIALTNKEGYCWASNQYFADLFDKNDKYISSKINHLAKLGYIQIQVEKEKGNSRKIWIPIQKNLNTYSEKPEYPYSEKPEHNNTSNNNTNNIINNNDIEKKHNLAYARLLAEGQNTEEFQKKYGISQEQVVDIAEELVNYVASTGRRYKDYKATMHNWIKRKHKNIQKKDDKYSKLIVLPGKIIN